MPTKRKIRLAVVISHATQHFGPLYAHLADSDELELKVFFVAENGVNQYHDRQFGVDVQWDVPLNQGYLHEFLNPGLVLDKFTFFTVDAKRVSSALTDFGPDVVWIHGYAQRVNWRVIFTKFRQWSVLYSSDSNLSDHRPFIRKLIKAVVVRCFFARCDHFLSISDSNTNYLNSFGVPKSQISETTFPIDIQRWSDARDKLLSIGATDSLREFLSIPKDITVFLFAGKLINFKRPQDILFALKQLDTAPILVYVGDGPELKTLKLLAEELDVEAQVRFVGFVNQNELAQYFMLSDILVFPSEKEPYGAISAEVLPFGLPIIASKAVGAIGKSIIENDNALLYESGDIAALASCMQTLSEQPDLASRFAAKSFGLAASHDKSKMSHDIMQYCRSVLGASDS